MKRTTRFRELLRSPELEILLEAHNGISARIAEEAGFRALWAGGLCLSAQFGVRDCNEASWTQVLEMLEFMADATALPILVDGDTGHGNFNNVRRLVSKLESRGLAALCIEDKLYPKTNSFIDGRRQRLADSDEFCSRIRAGKEAARDDDFCLVARVEAFIAGWGLEEALKRAEAYRQAGADAILIHSALRDPGEVLAFKKEWGDRLPVLIVPTKYYATPTDVFRRAGFSMAIFANQMLRAAVVAYRECAARLRREQSLVATEDRIAPLEEIFRLQGAPELQEAEARYLRREREEARVVILAASRGAELGELTAERPKAMVEVGGRPLLGHIVAAWNAMGLRHVTVVRGYRKEAIDLPGLGYVDNPDPEGTGELLSLALALAGERGEPADLYVSFGDVLFKRYLAEALAEQEDAIAIAVDTAWRDSVNRSRAADYVACSEPHARHDPYRRTLLVRAGEDLPEAAIHGEWTGLLRVARPAVERFRAVVARLAADPTRRRDKLHHLLTALVEAGQEVRVVYTTGHWLDVDTLEDLVAAGRFA